MGKEEGKEIKEAITRTAILSFGRINIVSIT